MSSEKEQILNFIEKHKIIFNEKNWTGERNCPKCEKNIIYSATKKFYLIRNIKRAINKKTLCLKCSTSGDNNPFFGKKHTSQTKKKISKSRQNKCCGVNNPMNDPIKRQKISDKLKEKYKNGKINKLKKIKK